MARHLRRMASPSGARDMKNPFAFDQEVLARARAQFADHCASCHGNDGRGRTTVGQNLYPKAADMRSGPTRSFSDGEIFYTIKNGVRLTGMPAWGDGYRESDRETWELVHLIRHLPRITPGELKQMEDLNPKSRKQLEEEEEDRRFLERGGEQPSPPGQH